jgi:ADP-ribose pyrophosphatase YjhB (NUDIX family)
VHTHDLVPPYRFCPLCGGALERRRLKPSDPERLVCADAACGFVFYLDPKVAVGTIIRAEDDDRVVLVRRAIEPGYGKWVYPGGYVDRGELVQDAAVREAREESGLIVSLGRLINVYSYPGRAPVVIVYEAAIIGGALCADDECLEAQFFEPHEIPWDDLAFPSTHDALREYLGAVAARR